MGKTKVIVVTHKEFDDSKLTEGYQVVTVGPNAPHKEGWVHDNTGDNVAHENPYYCELTAQYWAWKNLPEDVENVGLVHYRRYFMDYKVGSDNYCQDILSIQKAEEILEKYCIIVPIRSFKNSGSSILYRRKPIEKQDPNWLLIQKIINRDFPEEAAAFDKVIYGRTQVWCNMLITKRKYFDAYTRWIFDVLGKYDEELKIAGKERTPRVDGYLSELLILVWITAHIPSDKVYYCPMENNEDAPMIPYEVGGIAKIRRNLRAKHKKAYVRYRGIRTRIHICKMIMKGQ